jgi:hypothetical protein
LAISFRENYDDPKKMRAVSNISLGTELFTRAISTLEIEEPGQAPVNSGEGTNNNFACAIRRLAQTARQRKLDEKHFLGHG